MKMKGLVVVLLVAGTLSLAVGSVLKKHHDPKIADPAGGFALLPIDFQVRMEWESATIMAGSLVDRSIVEDFYSRVEKLAVPDMNPDTPGSPLEDLYPLGVLYLKIEKLQLDEGRPETGISSF